MINIKKSESHHSQMDPILSLHFSIYRVTHWFGNTFNILWFTPYLIKVFQIHCVTLYWNFWSISCFHWLFARSFYFFEQNLNSVEEGTPFLLPKNEEEDLLSTLSKCCWAISWAAFEHFSEGPMSRLILTFGTFQKQVSIRWVSARPRL